MTLVVLLLAGVAILGLLWLLPRPRHAEALAAWARSHDAVVSGDGVSLPLHALGTARGRTWTLLFQDPTLLVAVDCDAAEGGLLDGVPVEVDDGVLVLRITRPDRSWFDSGRLDRTLNAMVALAEDLEARAPAPPHPE